MGSLSCVSTTVILLCSVVSASCMNCTVPVLSWEATGIAVGISFFLIIGVVVGIACSIAAYKFMKWMEGKKMVFTPCPRIISSNDNRDHMETTLHNPTYEIEAAPTGLLNPATSKQPPDLSNPSRLVYEAIDEPSNEAESNFECQEPTLMPYAIHDFSEGSMEQRNSNKSANISKGAPKVAIKVHLKKKKDGGEDSHRSMSESDAKSKKLVKPPTAKKINTATHVRPVPKSRANSQAGHLEPPHAAYSELEPKTSYATLEPHMGDRLDDRTFSEHDVKESYCHLNR